MSAPERKPSLLKAPAIGDNLAALMVQSPATPVEPLRSPRLDSLAPPEPIDRHGAGMAPPRRGRPRERELKIPFSTRIPLELRDQLDDYLGRSGQTIAEVTEQALRRFITGME